MKRPATVFLLMLGLARVWGQGLATAPPADSRTTPYAAEREQTLAPAMEAMQRHDYPAALGMLEVVLPSYPHDGRVLMLAGRAAHLSGDDAKALGFYKTALSFEPPAYTQWQLHLEVVPLYAAAGDWVSFDAERAKSRAAALSAAPHFPNISGYEIEVIRQGDTAIHVQEFPRLFGRFHTRYRFLFPVDAAAPNWTPYLACESDDIDQVSFAKEHPDSAAKGERSFSLDAYMRPNTHGTIRLFGDGEPTYETVRELVVKKAEPIVTTVLH